MYHAVFDQFSHSSKRYLPAKSPRKEEVGHNSGIKYPRAFPDRNNPSHPITQSPLFPPSPPLSDCIPLQGPCTFLIRLWASCSRSNSVSSGHPLARICSLTPKWRRYRLTCFQHESTLAIRADCDSPHRLDRYFAQGPRRCPRPISR